jgi:hypothetical protein
VRYSLSISSFQWITRPRKRGPDTASLSSIDHNQGILGGKMIESALHTDDGGNPILTQRTIFQCWDHGCGGRNFSSLSNYRRRCRERSTEAAICCPHCSKTFTRASGRNLHIEQRRCPTLNWDLLSTFGDGQVAFSPLGTDGNNQSYTPFSQQQLEPSLGLESYWFRYGQFEI